VFLGLRFHCLSCLVEAPRNVSWDDDIGLLPSSLVEEAAGAKGKLARLGEHNIPPPAASGVFQLVVDLALGTFQYSCVLECDYFASRSSTSPPSPMPIPWDGDLYDTFFARTLASRFLPAFWVLVTSVCLAEPTVNPCWMKLCWGEG
jgi:hypothetical protein